MDSLVDIATALATGYRAKAQMYHLNFNRLKSTAKDNSTIFGDLGE